MNRVEYKINIPKEIDIMVFDLNVIFGNHPENAILTLRSSIDKWLFVDVKYDKRMLLIYGKNSYAGRVIKQKKYLSTKKTSGETWYWITDCKAGCKKL